MYSLTGLIGAGMVLQDFTAKLLNNQTDGDRRAGIKWGIQDTRVCGACVAE